MAFDKPTITAVNSTKLIITDLDTVISENMSVTNRNITFSMPLGNTAKNRLSNWKGNVRQILVTGLHTGVSYGGSSPKEKIKAFIEEVEDWINNDDFIFTIQGRHQYNDVYGNSFKVFCTKFNVKWNAAQNHITYTMTLIEGGSIIGNSYDILQ